MNDAAIGPTAMLIMVLFLWYFCVRLLPATDVRPVSFNAMPTHRRNQETCLKADTARDLHRGPPSPNIYNIAGPSASLRFQRTCSVRNPFAPTANLRVCATPS